MKTIQLPNSLKYFPRYLTHLDFDDAHKMLIRAIQRLYIQGYSYKTVKEIAELYKCRKYIFKKYNEPSGYPYVKTMIDFVFTRDKVINPFGPWVFYNFFDPLQIFDYAKFLIAKNEWKLKPDKLAGVLFAFLSFERFLKLKQPDRIIKSFSDIEQNKEYMSKVLGINKNRLSKLEKENAYFISDSINNNQNAKALVERKRELIELIEKYKADKDIGYIDNPKVLYQLSGITQQYFHKYTTKLGVITLYQNYKIKGYKTRLWIADFKKLKQDFEDYKKDNKIDFDIFNRIKERNIKSGINFQGIDRSFARLCNNYEKRFLCDKTSYINKMCLDGNPFIRIFNNDKYVKITFQISLFSYPLLLKALYGSLPKEITSKIELILNDDSQKQIAAFKTRLTKENLYNNLHPISTPRRPNDYGKHFEQIDKSWKIISRISKHGIRIDLSETKKLLSETKEKLDSFNQVKDISQMLNEIGSLNDFLNDYVEEVAEAYCELINQPKSLEKRKETLLKIIASAESIKNKSDEHILKGLFSPHGSKTHRLSCRDFNLQGTSKLISKRILTTKPGFTLLSADVSGQDITVAANVAYRLFKNRNNFDRIPKRKKEKLDEKELGLLLPQTLNDNWQKIQTTIQALKSRPKSTPIDFITDTLMTSYDLDITDNEIRKSIRANVKSTVYLTLYGGGKGTINKGYKKIYELLLNKLKEDCYRPIATEYINKYGSDCYPVKRYNKEIFSKDYLEISSSMQFMQNQLEGRCDSTFINNNLANSNVIFEAIDKYEMDFSNLKRIRENVVKILKNEYPGIIDSFDYYRIYYKLNGLTFPTFLNWQTVIDEKSYNIGDILKKSTNYVIQGSGVEFYRQWLIELAKVQDYARSWNIVNAIHDQIIIEVMDKYVDMLKTELLNSAKKAARIVGMDSETLNIPEPEDLLAIYHSQQGL